MRPREWVPRKPGSPSSSKKGSSRYADSHIPGTVRTKARRARSGKRPYKSGHCHSCCIIGGDYGKPPCSTSKREFIRVAMDVNRPQGRAPKRGPYFTPNAVSFMPSGVKMRSRRNVSNVWPEARDISSPSTYDTVLYIRFSPGWCIRSSVANHRAQSSTQERFSRVCTSGYAPLLAGVSSLVTLVLIRGALFLDGPAPTYQRPPSGK
jgi:hypothetical protein